MDPDARSWNMQSQDEIRRELGAKPKATRTRKPPQPAPEPAPPPTDDEHMLSLDVGDGDKVDVYLRRQSGDPSDPAYFLSCELSFSTPHMVGSVHGLRAKQLRQLARMLVEFARELDSEDDR
jgi:hypothetical protein